MSDLTDAEREAVYVAGIHTFGCTHADHLEQDGARQDTITAAVERIVAAREQAIRERIAQAIEALAVETVRERPGHGGYDRTPRNPRVVRDAAARIARVGGPAREGS